MGSTERSEVNLTKITRNNLMGIVYILFSKKLNKFYIGVSVDIDRRLNEHNSGKSKFTSRGVPWQLMYTEVFPTLIEAKKRELQIKKRKSRIYLQELINCNSSNPRMKMVLGSPAQERDSGITSE